MTATLIVIAALALDRLLGEPQRLHPPVGFGLPGHEADWPRLGAALDTVTRTVSAEVAP